MSSENRVTQSPIIPTFFYFAVPSLLGLLAISSASIVDGIFVGRYLGADALAAINLLVPFLTFMFATSLMIAIGGTVKAGKYIGEDDYDKANAVFTQSLITVFGFAVVMALITGLFSETLFGLLGAPTEVHPLMLKYFSVISLCLIIQLSSLVLYYFVRADGFPVLATVALSVGAATNVVLDIVFLGYLGLGIEWAAWATVIAQTFQLLTLSTFFFEKRRNLCFSISNMKLSDLFSSLINGSSEFINEISVGIVILIIHWLLVFEGGQAAVAGFSVANYMLFFSMMAYYGIVDAIHILISQNFGAGNWQRIRQFMMMAGSSVLTISLGFVYVAQNGASAITQLFFTDAVTASSKQALFYISVIWPCLLFSGFNVLISAYFTALQKPVQSLIIALSRGLVLPVALLLCFAFFFKENHFLLALPLAESITLIIAVSLFLLKQEEIKKQQILATQS
ncbi:MATE family efflux transporter [Enterovibrio coralii]|uniref:Multidrug resistance protein NorM n=1 Tax=Enterovibrio coralii TaxID=294935 RepID=A0A135IAQ6_9GAMM|nr:MATE family efflux transporter [Enterovibrio coralii]KXF82550.1 multidrug transporter MatE [Enterovibrio coralii]